MSAGIAALRNDDVGSRLRRPYGPCEPLPLADQFGASIFDWAGIGSWLSERDHHHRRLRGKRHVECLWILIERPSNEADSDTGVACCREFLFDRRRVGVARTDQAKASSIRYRCCELATGCRSHGSQEDGVCYPEQPGERRLDRDHAVLPQVSTSTEVSCLLCILRPTSHRSRKRSSPEPIKSTPSATSAARPS